MLQKRVRLEGFIILDHYASRFHAFRRDMSGWVEAGKITLREHRVAGLENAPAAFIGMLQEHNRGKVVVSVADE